MSTQMTKNPSPEQSELEDSLKDAVPTEKVAESVENDVGETKKALQGLLKLMQLNPQKELTSTEDDHEQPPEHKTVRLASEEDDTIDDEPSDNYERFLKQFANAAEVRKAILNFANMRVAQLEHLANCWKLLSLCQDKDIKNLFEILLKKEGSLTEFEEKAYLKPYATTEFCPESASTSYPEYLRQFFPGLPINNFFPELGPVTGEVPSCLKKVRKTTLMKMQPMLVIDPKSFEQKIEQYKIEKLGANNKKKTKYEKVEIKAVPVFDESAVKKSIELNKISPVYQKMYARVPSHKLAIEGLSAIADEHPLAVGVQLVSDEFDEAIGEYKNQAGSQVATVGRILAEKYAKKRLQQLDQNYDPMYVATYKKILERLDEEMVIEVNAIHRYYKDTQKFKRLEEVLLLKYYNQ